MKTETVELIKETMEETVRSLLDLCMDESALYGYVLEKYTKELFTEELTEEALKAASTDYPEVGDVINEKIKNTFGLQLQSYVPNPKYKYSENVRELDKELKTLKKELKAMQKEEREKGIATPMPKSPKASCRNFSVHSA